MSEHKNPDVTRAVLSIHHALNVPVLFPENIEGRMESNITPKEAGFEIDFPLAGDGLLRRVVRVEVDEEIPTNDLIDWKNNIGLVKHLSKFNKSKRREVGSLRFFPDEQKGVEVVTIPRYSGAEGNIVVQEKGESFFSALERALKENPNLKKIDTDIIINGQKVKIKSSFGVKMALEMLHNPSFRLRLNSEEELFYGRLGEITDYAKENNMLSLQDRERVNDYMSQANHYLSQNYGVKLTKIVIEDKSIEIYFKPIPVNETSGDNFVNGWRAIKMLNPFAKKPLAFRRVYRVE